MNSKRGKPYSGGERHTHFVGISLPPDVEESVGDFRSWMEGAYGCKSGHGTPPHITLLPPFTLPPEYTEQDVFSCCKDAVNGAVGKGFLPLPVSLDGFGSFSERTLFVNVMDGEGWQNLYGEFVRTFQTRMPGLLKKSGRRFYPHISVANRDIPPGTMDEALRHFAQLGFHAAFEAASVTVFGRTRTGGWAAAAWT